MNYEKPNYVMRMLNGDTNAEYVSTTVPLAKRPVSSSPSAGKGAGEATGKPPEIIRKTAEIQRKISAKSDGSISIKRLVGCLVGRLAGWPYVQGCIEYTRWEPPLNLSAPVPFFDPATAGTLSSPHVVVRGGGTLLRSLVLLLLSLLLLLLMPL